MILQGMTPPKFKKEDSDDEDTPEETETEKQAIEEAQRGL